MQHGHGGKPDPPDERDLPHPKTPAAVKTHVDLSTWRWMPEVWSQGPCDSCVPHAVAAAWQFATVWSKVPPVTLSRLFIWYEGRLLENSVAVDTGIAIRTALKVLYITGAPPEAAWPYDPDQYLVKPPPEAYEQAPQHKAQNFFAVKPAHGQTQLERLKAVLADGYPVCFYFHHTRALESPEVAQSGVLPMPKADEPLVGDGHAGLLVGYDDDASTFKVRNSYGKCWGQQGYFTMPYEYVTSPYAKDFWTVRRVD
jgi:C1A family cysteine protease